MITLIRNTIRVPSMSIQIIFVVISIQQKQINYAQQPFYFSRLLFRIYSENVFWFSMKVLSQNYNAKITCLIIMFKTYNLCY